MVMNKMCNIILLVAAMLGGQGTAAQGVVIHRQGWFDGKVSEPVALAEGTARLDIEGLQPGLHSFTMRVQDNQGAWSSPLTQFFVVPSSVDKAHEIVWAEAWLDGKFAQRQSLPQAHAEIDVMSLTPGLHTLTMRVQDNNGLWSGNMTQYFVVPYQTQEPAEIAQCVGWVDGNVKQRQTLNPHQAIIDVTGLTVGIHLFTAVAQDTRGRWSSPLSQYFLIPLEQHSGVTVDRCMYWFNDSVQNTQYAALDSVCGIVDLDISHLAQGEHTLWWRVRDTKGAWSEPFKQTFTITMSEYLLGDVNSDGNVDIADVNIIINVMLGRDLASNYGHRCYVTDDETVDISDVNAVINIMLGK